MSNYSSLKATINANIKTNGNQEITGAILNSVLNAIVDSVGMGFQYVGVATESTNPGSPDQRVFYFATQAGTYTNFGGISVGDGEVAILRYDTSWHKDVIGAASKEQFDAVAARVSDMVNDLYETTQQTTDISDSQDGVLSGYYIAANGKIYGSATYSIRYKLINDGMDISYANTDGSSCVAVASGLPAQGGQADSVIKYGTGTGDGSVPAGKYLWWAFKTSTPAKTKVYQKTTTVGDIKDFVEENEIGQIVDNAIQSNDTIQGDIGFVKSRGNLDDLRQRADLFSPMLVDWMQEVHGVNGMTDVSQMQVVSFTSSTLTLSASDAASFDSDTPAVVGFSNGTYKVVYFKAYPGSGTTITKASFDTTDLTGASTLQSLHDTIKGGAGIHLSPMGYLSLAQFTAQECETLQAMKCSNLIAGINFYNATQSGDYIIDTNGNVIASFSKTMADGGGVDGSLKYCGIKTGRGAYSGYSYGWINNGFGLLQGGTSGLYAEFEIPAAGSGFVEIQGALMNSTGNRVGGVNVEVFADGVSQGTKSLVFYQKRLVFSGVRAKKTIKVRFSLTSTSPTNAVIYGINFWSMPSDISAISLSGKKVAFLGDSWTQFPNVGTGLSDHESYNERVVRPDGTNGDGYGYLPKEFARVTGASVDNWGKSNMRADNWGLVKIDEILNYADYDYLILEFFINDKNAGISVNDWARNIAKICRKCYSAGVRPIVICPCRTNSATTNGDYWQKMFRGIGVI